MMQKLWGPAAPAPLLSVQCATQYLKVVADVDAKRKDVTDNFPTYFADQVVSKIVANYSSQLVETRKLPFITTLRFAADILLSDYCVGKAYWYQRAVTSIKDGVFEFDFTNNTAAQAQAISAMYDQDFLAGLLKKVSETIRAKKELEGFDISLVGFEFIVDCLPQVKTLQAKAQKEAEEAAEKAKKAADEAAEKAKLEAEKAKKAADEAAEKAKLEADKAKTAAEAAKPAEVAK
jgi:hypothetical protein